MDKKKLLGLRIRTMRRSRRMTQSDLAKSINQSQSSITMYENGRREPDFETLEALADVFNVPLVSLIDDMSGLSLDLPAAHLLSAYNNLPTAGKEYINQQLRVAQVIFSEKSSEYNKKEE